MMKINNIKNLFYKTVKLNIPYGMYLIALLGLLVIVPNYPIIIGIAYAFVPIFNILVSINSYDNEFNITLPIPRKHIILSKYMIMLIFQALALLFAAIGAVIALNFVYPIVMPEGNPVGISCNITFFAIGIIGFAISNYVFLTQHFKNTTKLGVPFLLGLLSFLGFYAVSEILLILIPALKTIFYSIDIEMFKYQAILLVVSILLFISLMFLTYKKSIKNFEKVNI